MTLIKNIINSKWIQTSNHRTGVPPSIRCSPEWNYWASKLLINYIEASSTLFYSSWLGMPTHSPLITTTTGDLEETLIYLASGLKSRRGPERKTMRLKIRVQPVKNVSRKTMVALEQKHQNNFISERCMGGSTMISEKLGSLLSQTEILISIQFCCASFYGH